MSEQSSASCQKDRILSRTPPSAGLETEGACGAESAVLRSEGSGGSFSMLSVASCSPFCSSVSCLQPRLG